MDNKNQLHEIDPAWCLTEEMYNCSTGKHYEGLFTQGNGYMNIRGSFEEGLLGTAQDEEYLRMPANVTLEQPRHPETKWGTFIPGIVGQHPLLKEEIVNLPYFLLLNLSVSGEKLDMNASKVKNYKRWLDLRDGCLHRSFLWETKSGLVLQVIFRRFLSMAEKHLYFQKVSVKALSGQGVVHMECGIDFGVRTNGYNHFQRVLTADSGKDYISAETLTDKGNRVLMCSALKSAQDIIWKKESNDHEVCLTGSRLLKPGDFIEVQKATSVATDRDLDEGNLYSRCERDLQSFKETDWYEMYRKHAEVWAEKWKFSDVKVTGDEKAQLAIRMSVYHLIRSNCEDDPRVAICAKGYAGEAYFGRYFWDTEISMLPFFLHTNPKAAKNLILFRYNTLNGARKNATDYGYDGARYAWESSVTGEEQCPNWQYADHEIHITADIVYAICHYVCGTGDVDFVWDYGIDIMVETARYWVKRVDRDKDGCYRLLGVMGPDEYLPMTMNNSYTNRMVKFSLAKTVEFLKTAKKDYSDKYFEIKKRLNLKKDETELFQSVGEKLVLPYNHNTEVIPQSEDFDRYADIDFDLVWTDRTKPFGNCVSQEKNYRSKALKQADVLELMQLFPEDFSRNQLVKAYDYYEPITTHDSSLSAAVHGILAARMGQTTEAEKFFQKVIETDMSIQKRGAAEGIHIANCGGLWQLIVYGFAGLKSALWCDKIELEPHLPKKWEKLEFSLAWHGNRYKIVITPDKYEISEWNRNV